MRTSVHVLYANANTFKATEKKRVMFFTTLATFCHIPVGETLTPPFPLMSQQKLQTDDIIIFDFDTNFYSVFILMSKLNS